ncbi:hypothetical protein ACJX0J_009883, partial [Zea mays]
MSMSGKVYLHVDERVYLHIIFFLLVIANWTIGVFVFKGIKNMLIFVAQGICQNIYFEYHYWLGSDYSCFLKPL